MYFPLIYLFSYLFFIFFIFFTLSQEEITQTTHQDLYSRYPYDSSENV